MAKEFDRDGYEHLLTQFKSMVATTDIGDSDAFKMGVDCRKDLISMLKIKYPDLSEGALSWMIDYELDENATDFLHTEYEEEALKAMSGFEG